MVQRLNHRQHQYPGLTKNYLTSNSLYSCARSFQSFKQDSTSVSIAAKKKGTMANEQRLTKVSGTQ